MGVNCSSTANENVDDAGEMKQLPEPNMMAPLSSPNAGVPIPAPSAGLVERFEHGAAGNDAHGQEPPHVAMSEGNYLASPQFHHSPQFEHSPAQAPIASPMVQGSAAPPVMVAPVVMRASMGQQSHVSQQDGYIPPEHFFQPRVCEGGNCPAVTHEEFAPGQFRSIMNPEEVLYAHDFEAAAEAGLAEHISEHIEVPVASGQALDSEPQPEQQPALYVGAVQEVGVERTSLRGQDVDQERDANAERDPDAHQEIQPESGFVRPEPVPAKKVARKKGKRRGRKKKTDKRGWF